MSRSTKGQLSIEYFVAMIIFIFFVVYFLFQISNLVPEFTGEMEVQRIRSEAYQISEIIINSPGMPTNWNTLPYQQTVLFGLSNQTFNKTNLLSSSKMASMGSTCASLGQQAIRSKLYTDLEMSMLIVDRTDGTPRLDCSAPRNDTRGFSVTVKRIVAFDDGRFGDLTLQMWRP